MTLTPFDEKTVKTVKVIRLLIIGYKRKNKMESQVNVFRKTNWICQVQKSQNFTKQMAIRLARPSCVKNQI